jgi:hypothetical protein
MVWLSTGTTLPYLYVYYVCVFVPVSMAERSKACAVYDRSNIEITGSNPASGMDVCPRVSVLCCPGLVEALHQADPPSKESYQNVSICKSRKPIRVGQRSVKDCAFFFFKCVFVLKLYGKTDHLPL